MSTKSVSKSCAERKRHSSWTNSKIKESHGSTRVQENIFCKKVVVDFNSAESFEDFEALDDIDDIREVTPQSKEQPHTIYRPLNRWLHSQVGQPFDDVFSKFIEEFGKDHDAKNIFHWMTEEVRPERKSYFFKDENGLFQKSPKRVLATYQNRTPEANAFLAEIKAPSNKVELKGETYRWIYNSSTWRVWWSALRPLTKEELEKFLALDPEVRRLIEVVGYTKNDPPHQP